MRALALADARATAAEAGMAALQAKLADLAASASPTSGTISPVAAADGTDVLSLELHKLRERLAAGDAHEAHAAQQSLRTAVAKLHANGAAFSSSLRVRCTPLPRRRSGPSRQFASHALCTLAMRYLFFSRRRSEGRRTCCEAQLSRDGEWGVVPSDSNNLLIDRYKSVGGMQSLASSRIGTSFNASATEFPPALARLASGSPTVAEAALLRQECAAALACSWQPARVGVPAGKHGVPRLNIEYLDSCAVWSAEPPSLRAGCCWRRSGAPRWSSC